MNGTKVDFTPLQTFETPHCQYGGCGAYVHTLGSGHLAKYCDRHRIAAIKEKAHKAKVAKREREPGPVRTAAGYMMVWDPADPMGNRVPRYRLVMAAKLGRALLPGESVHHRNGVRDDDRPENLELWVGPIRAGQRADEVRCPHCGEPWISEQP